MAGKKDNKKEAKEVIIKLQIPAGKATPAPPVGTALGPHGVNIMGFCNRSEGSSRPVSRASCGVRRASTLSCRS